MELSHPIARHYARGGLERAILDAVTASGNSLDRLTAADLSGVDEFHIGWRPATIEFATLTGLREGMHVLDIGSGIGGPARYFAEVHGCRVTGIDLTQEYVDVANTLTHLCGLDGQVSFRQASAFSLPFTDDAFDAATLIHVGMNIADKAALFAEVRRVVRPGGLFGLYEVVRISGGTVIYPTPWAACAETSYLESAEVYRRDLTAAGFVLEVERDMRDLAFRVGREMQDRIRREGPPAMGLHLLMGPEAPQRLGNMMTALKSGIVAPIVFVARGA